MGVGGVGLLLGGMPSGWLLDRYPGHAVLAVVLAIQVRSLHPACSSLVREGQALATLGGPKFTRRNRTATLKQLHPT